MAEDVCRESAFDGKGEFKWATVRSMRRAPVCPTLSQST